MSGVFHILGHLVLEYVGADDRLYVLIVTMREHKELCWQLRSLCAQVPNVQYDTVWVQAIKNGWVNCLEYLRVPDLPCTHHMVKAAVENGHFDCVKYLISIGCPMKEDAGETAVIHGQLDCLKFLMDSGLIVTESMIDAAVIHGGRLEYLKFLLDISQSFVITAVKIAAKKCKLECLKFLLKIKPHLAITAAIAATEHGQFGCLEYLIESGCPIVPCIQQAVKECERRRMYLQ